MYDLLISNAKIFDGLGSEPFAGQLAVKDGRIAAVRRAAEPIDPAQAREHVDAKGLALMPGIIDNHTHYDAQITWDSALSPSPALGVTTAIIGNCGFTIAPCRPADRELIMRNLTQVEGMSLDVLRQDIRWDFESIRPFVVAYLGDGRGCAQARCHPCRSAGNEAPPAGGHAGRRDRLFDQHLASAQRRGRHPHAFATGR